MSGSPASMVGSDDGWSTDFGPDSTGSEGSWSDPAGADAPSGDEIPAPSGSGAELVPLEGASSTWVDGPAPTLDDDEGPSGLEPVSWYTEPGASTVEASDPMGDSIDELLIDPTETISSDQASATSQAQPAAGGFDRDAIFRDDEPEPAAAPGTAVEPAALRVNWQASADAWATPVEPEGKPKGQALLSREARLLAFAILVVVLAVAGKVLLDRRSNYPSEWSANVQPVANWVASTRKLPFDHPVAVVSRPAGEYDAVVRAAAEPQDSQQELRDQVAMWRALGGIQGNPTASLGIITEQHPEYGAFYDPSSKRLELRQGTTPAQLRVAAAGALSVALDAQHGDVKTLTDPTMAESPLLDVVTGNAASIRTAYFATLPKAEQQSLTALLHPSLKETANLLEARTILRPGTGHPFVDMVREVEDVQSVNGLVTTPPASSQQILDASTYFDGRDPLTGSEPGIPGDAQSIERGTIGAEGWYLLLAGRLPVARGFTMIDTWAGDDYVAYRKTNGQVCVIDTLRGADESSTRELASMLTEWSRSIPGGRVEVKAPEGDLVTVTGCDPGAGADQALKNRYRTAVRSAVIRSELAAYVYKRGTEIPNGPNGPLFTPQVAWCLADQVVHQAQPGTLDQIARHEGFAYQSYIASAGKSCGTEMTGQLVDDPGS